MRILHLKGPVEVALQFCKFEIGSLIVKYEPKNGLLAVSLLHLLLIIQSFPMRLKSSFSLMSLPIHKICLKIKKSMFKEMFWEGGLKLLVIGLGILYVSLVIFCHNCHRRPVSRIRGGILK